MHVAGHAGRHHPRRDRARIEKRAIDDRAERVHVATDGVELIGVAVGGLTGSPNETQDQLPLARASVISVSFFSLYSRRPAVGCIAWLDASRGNWVILFELLLKVASNLKSRKSDEHQDRGEPKMNARKSINVRRHFCHPPVLTRIIMPVRGVISHSASELFKREGQKIGSNKDRAF
jgi:hypothetical protein